MNIPDIVTASITSVAFLGGGISLYSSSESRDALIEERVADLLIVAEKGSQSITGLSTAVNALEIKQKYNDKAQAELMYSLRDLTREIKGVNKHLLIMRGHDEQI